MTLLGFLYLREMISALSPTLVIPWISVMAHKSIFCSGLPYGSLFPSVFCGIIFCGVSFFTYLVFKFSFLLLFSFV